MPTDPADGAGPTRPHDPRSGSCAGMIPPPGDASAALPDAPPPSPPALDLPLVQPGGRSRTLGNVAMLFSFVIIAGLTHPAAKDAIDGGIPGAGTRHGFPPLTLGFARFAIAALLLLLTQALLTRRGDPRPRPIERSDWPRLLIAAALCVPLNQAFFLIGIRLSSPSHGGLFYGLNPVLLFLLTLMLGRARWSPRIGLAALLAFGGAMLAVAENLQDRWSLLGDGLLLGAVLTWAAFTLVLGPLSTRYGALRAITLVMGLGALMNLPVLLVDAHELRPSELTARAVAGFVFITVLTSFVNYILWTVALTRIDVNRIAVTVNAGPLVAVIASHYWRGDPLTQWLAGATVLIVAAIALANWDKLRALRWT
ncbi:MAG: DMT family transporter [Phycisphaerales bacterium]|nr:DMT family transporter [Phycisphaerales bacterium]